MRSVRALAKYGAIAMALPISHPAGASLLEKSETINGIALRYKVVLPNGFDPAKTYPAVLAFPPGGQGMDLVDATLSQSYRAEAERRGTIVVEPAAPNGMLFFAGGDRVFPAFLDKLTRDYKILDNKFHAAGNSNGGRSAFLIASRFPQYFWSVTGFPGFLGESTDAGMKAIGGMCIHMFVGELDSGWPEAMREQAAALRKSGYKVTFSVEPGEPHVIRTLMGAGAVRLYDQFEQARKGTCAK